VNIQQAYSRWRILDRVHHRKRGGREGEENTEKKNRNLKGKRE
jgi:hypothetical protein